MLLNGCKVDQVSFLPFRGILLEHLEKVELVKVSLC